MFIFVPTQEIEAFILKRWWVYFFSKLSFWRESNPFSHPVQFFLSPEKPFSGVDTFSEKWSQFSPSICGNVLLLALFRVECLLKTTGISVASLNYVTTTRIPWLQRKYTLAQKKKTKKKPSCGSDFFSIRIYREFTVLIQLTRKTEICNFFKKNLTDFLIFPNFTWFSLRRRRWNITNRRILIRNLFPRNSVTGSAAPRNYDVSSTEHDLVYTEPNLDES